MAEITLECPKVYGKRIKTGRRIGMLKIIGFAGSLRVSCGKPVKRWLCKCDCGNLAIITQPRIDPKKKMSCGCASRVRIQRPSEFIGAKSHVLYGRWYMMIQRCCNPKHASYPDYGGRGIKICKRWRYSFRKFIKDMEPGFRKGLSIDRIDVNGNYCPKNCRWATNHQQINNRRISRFVIFRGEKKTIGELAKEFGVKWARVNQRIHLGWSVEDAIFHPAVKPSQRALCRANRESAR